MAFKIPGEPTLEQKRARQPFEEEAGIITATTLEPSANIDFATSKDSTIDVSKLELTPAQKQAQTETDELGGLLKKLGGETELRTQLEEERGVAGLEKVTTEQGIIVKNLQIEAQALANEFAGVQDVMQQQAIGRGITKGGLAPLTAGEQRKIAIQQRSVASQALTAYAAYNTAQGNLQVAQQAIDRAVSAKFDPIREQINIKKQNLELLLGSPLASAQEKALATAQLKRQNAEEEKVNEQQGFYETIQKLYVELAATPDINPATVNTIRQILNKEEITIDDVSNALVLAREAGIGVTKEPLKTQIVEVAGRKLLVNTQTGETIQDLGAVAIPGQQVTPAGTPIPTGTSSQFVVANYASRIQQANTIFNELEDKIEGLGGFRLGLEGILPGFLKSDVVRQKEQAERNFINAVLRRESGAAIAPTEFESAEKQYFIQPGDDEGTLLQKKLNRMLVQQNFINEAGTAFVPTSLEEVPGRQAGLSDEEAYQEYLRLNQ